MAKNKKSAFSLPTIKGPKKSDLAKIPYLNLIYFSVALNVISIVFVFIFQRNIPPEIPLYYGLAEGESQLARSAELAVPAGVSLLIILVNVALTFMIKNEFLRKALVIAGFAVTLFSTITIFKIAFLVGSF